MNRNHLYIFLLGAMALTPATAADRIIAIMTPSDSEIFTAPPRPKVTVPSKTRNPVNIPTSTHRFRPETGESNTPWEINCWYHSGDVVLMFSNGMGEARVMITSPENPGGRIFRLDSSKRELRFHVGTKVGEYRIEVLTSRYFGEVFEFTVVD